MIAPRRCALTFFLLTALAACADPADPAIGGPSLHWDHNDRLPIVVVDPSGRHGRPVTIQAGIDLAPEGGLVLVLSGTYTEAVIINKGVRLVGFGFGHSHGVTVAAPAGTADAIQVTTTNAVVIRGITVHAGTVHGIHGIGAVDLTIEEATVTTVNPPLGTGRLIRLTNDPNPSGARARFVVRRSFIDGTVIDQPAPFPQVFGISLTGDVDGRLERNVIRRTGGACIAVLMRLDLGGVQNVEIEDNDLDECHPQGRAGALTVGLGGTATTLPSETQPITATGIVNILGNTIRNSAGACVTTTAIHYGAYTGRVEHNRILDVIQECATPTVRVLPAAILVGDNRPFFPAPTPVVRFNDIVGNAHAGLRINPAQNVPVDARCNYWGTADGPSGVASGTGDAVIVEAGGAQPVYAPFATGAIANGGRRHHGFFSGQGHHDRESCEVEYSLWSEPVNLGAVINTAATEQNPTVSPDELSLYFGSSRPGGFGLTDIYVSRRASPSSPWGAPVNLGPIINTAGSEIGPNLSTDGRLLFFQSSRVGGHGDIDIWVSRRADRQNDLAWEAPVNLGPYVNTADQEGAPEYVPGKTKHGAILYFNRRPVGGLYDIYSVPLTQNDLPREAAAPVSELNTPSEDVGVTVSSDALELLVASNRPGTLGSIPGSIIDIWRSTRRSVRDPWSTPTNLGPPVSTVFNDRAPSLSGGDRVLIFTSQRQPGGFGSDDLWVSTRTRIRSHDH